MGTGEWIGEPRIGVRGAISPSSVPCLRLLRIRGKMELRGARMALNKGLAVGVLLYPRGPGEERLTEPGAPAGEDGAEASGWSVLESHRNATRVRVHGAEIRPTK
jgi:hypothetical protein